MGDFTGDELQEILRPIASLISKSEKAQQKLKPGTWQHTMLRENVAALRIASALLTGETPATPPASDDLAQALHAIESMIERTEKMDGKFAPGTSQHSLQRNRLAALHAAEAAVRQELRLP